MDKENFWEVVFEANRNDKTRIYPRANVLVGLGSVQSNFADVKVKKSLTISHEAF